MVPLVAAVVAGSPQIVPPSSSHLKKKSLTLASIPANTLIQAFLEFCGGLIGGCGCEGNRRLVPPS